ncbi:MAG: RNA polymerase sigma factor RpoD/SigA [Bacteroidetes bacterium]|nr:RNA polymerase sigma factor RpoD/SigA [Bacteroidota bacterium]
MRQLKIAKQITNRDTSSVDKYLQEIGREELLTSEQEVECAKKIKTGDREAFEMLTRSNLRFVVSVAKQYQNNGLSLSDLINEGNLGLIKAAKRFDETRGFKFISYAVWWIRQSILQAIAEQGRIVRLPLNKIGALNKINRKLSALEQEFEREPTADEIASALEMATDEIKEVMRHSGRSLSMDSPVTNTDDDNTASLLDLYISDDTPPPDTAVMNESLRREIDRVLATLSPKEAEIIRLFYGLSGITPLTLEEISEKYNLTRERVRQIKEKAIRRLKQLTRSRALKSYLG